MSVHSLKKIKESRMMLPHVNDMLKVLSLTEKALSHFKHYMPAMRVLQTIRNEKILLEGYKNQFEKVKATKGKIE